MVEKQYKYSIKNPSNVIGDPKVRCPLLIFPVSFWIKKSTLIRSTATSKAPSRLGIRSRTLPRSVSLKYSLFERNLGDQLIAKRRNEKFKRIKCSTLAKLLNQHVVEESIYNMAGANPDGLDSVSVVAAQNP